MIGAAAVHFASMGTGVGSTLFLEAFGEFSRGASLSGIASNDEDLYSVFNARAALMGWGTASGRPRPLLWGMNEAELTAGSDTARIGFVQVGLEGGVEPVMALPALVQCFDEALGRFGAVNLSALQLTALHLRSERSCASDLASSRNWFNAAQNDRVPALVAFDADFLGGRTEADLLAILQRRNAGPFEFGPLVTVPEQHSINLSVGWGHLLPSREPSRLGLSVTLPEWTASAVGWVLASVIDAACFGDAAERNCALRITRIE